MSILAGKKILVTRSLAQNAELIQKLESRNAVALVYPCLEIAFLPFELPETQFDWVIYTSQNTVKALKNITLNPLIQVASVGPACAEATAGKFLTPSTYNSQSLSELFKSKPPQKILLPQGDLADNSLAEALKHQGHEVTRLTVYNTRKPANPVDFNFGYLDAITFTSPSAAKNFLELTQPTPTPPAIACLGTTTYQAAQRLGFENLICAREHSLEGLVEILEEYFT